MKSTRFSTFYLQIRSSSHKAIPSFLPSHRTLEFRLTTSSNNNHNSQSQSNTIPPPNQLFTQNNFHHHHQTIDLFPRANNRREDNWTIRCTQIDHQGNLIKCQSMSKSDICAENGLQPRDLRRIDSRISNVVPSILVRDEAIIFNVLNIRALIKANSVLLFDHQSSPSVTVSSTPSEDEERDQASNHSSTDTETNKFIIRSAFVHNLIKNLQENNSSQYHHHHHPTNSSSEPVIGIGTLPYEFRALETMLGSVASSLEGELGVLKTLVSSILDGLERNIDREKLKQLLLYSRRLSSFNGRVRLVQECLDEILENDQDMADSYLSEKILNRVPRDPLDHEELEQLLESFSKYFEEILHEGNSILTNIKSTEEIIELILDSNRNTLLALDLKVSIATMGLGTGALIAGLFGMNLRTDLEHEPYAFMGVTCISLVTVSCAVGYGWMKLNRLRRIGLSESPSQMMIFNRSPDTHALYSNKLSSSQFKRGSGTLDWDGFGFGGPVESNKFGYDHHDHGKVRKFWGKCKD